MSLPAMGRDASATMSSSLISGSGSTSPDAELPPAPFLASFADPVSSPVQLLSTKAPVATNARADFPAFRGVSRNLDARDVRNKLAARDVRNKLAARGVSGNLAPRSRSERRDIPFITPNLSSFVRLNTEKGPPPSFSRWRTQCLADLELSYP